VRPLRRAPSRAVLAIAAVTALLTGGCQDGQLPRVAGDSAEVLGAAIDVLVLNYLDDTNAPGATVAVTKNGRLVSSKGYGSANHDTGEQMQPYHRTLVGSVSKVPTAIGLLRLVDQGKVGLEDPVYGSSVSVIWGPGQHKDLPGLIVSPDGVLADAGDYFLAVAHAVRMTLIDATEEHYRTSVEQTLDEMAKVRVKHLLSHTAGLLRSGAPEDAATKLFGEGSNDEALTYAQLHKYMLEGWHGLPFVFLPPGSDRAYSNHGFGVTGLIIQEQAGQAYYNYMQEHVFWPLGLSHVEAYRLYVDESLDAIAHTAQVETDDDGNETGRLVKDGLTAEEPLADRNVPTLGLATGGWKATARDLVRGHVRHRPGRQQPAAAHARHSRPHAHRRLPRRRRQPAARLGQPRVQ
jgi:CubicO group peptidase (beta-lactamase class C family)